MTFQTVKKYRHYKCMLIVISILISFSMSGCMKNSEKNAEKEEVSDLQEIPQDVEVYYKVDEESNNVGEYDPWELSEEMNKEIVPPSEEKTTITFVALKTMGIEPTIHYVVEAFNRENKQYYVELETLNNGEELGIGWDRFRAELAAGKGPDIFTYGVFPVSYDMLESGMFVDLAPYMRASGITDEYFYPGYACFPMGDKIYGLSPEQSTYSLTLDKKVLNGDPVPEDIEGFLDKLLEYQGNASFWGNKNDGFWLLEYCLQGSGNLWGMIDWEQKKCNFSCELFSKMLDAAKRYQEGSEHGYACIITPRFLTFGSFELDSALDKQGQVVIDYYFDEGRFPYARTGMFAMFINANSEHMDGAWAFCSYAMLKRIQRFFPDPIHKETDRDSMEKNLYLMENGAPGYIMAKPFGQEELEELIEIRSCAKMSPEQTVKIRDIIYEEADSYISGSKSKEQVIDVIQNRVNLYLNE